MPIRGFIFDLDGTLVDTNWFHVEAWRQSFAAAGYEVPADKIAINVGKGGDQLIPAVLGKEVYERDGKETPRRLHQGVHRHRQAGAVRRSAGVGDAARRAPTPRIQDGPGHFQPETTYWI